MTPKSTEMKYLYIVPNNKAKKTYKAILFKRLGWKIKTYKEAGLTDGATYTKIIVNEII
jgi:hypothetical protein